MTPASQKQTLTLSLLGVILATSMVARVDSLIAWMMTVIVAFGSSILLLHWWNEMASATFLRLQQRRPSTYVSVLQRSGAAATTRVVSEWRRRRHARDLGWMSDQWLTEHRAARR